eukprot:2771848-Amphidinium_carterae.1
MPSLQHSCNGTKTTSDVYPSASAQIIGARFTQLTYACGGSTLNACAAEGPRAPHLRLYRQLNNWPLSMLGLGIGCLPWPLWRTAAT